MQMLQCNLVWVLFQLELINYAIKIRIKMFTFTSPNPLTFSPSANHCDPINTLKTTNVINLFWLFLNATSVIPLPDLITLSVIFSETMTSRSALTPLQL